MFAFQDLPPLSTTAFIALLGLVGLMWLALRVHLLRRLEAGREAGQSPVPASGWLRRVAAWPGTYPLLALLAAALAVVLVLGWGD